MTAHIRKPIKKTFSTSSSSFVRRAGWSGEAETLCGAPCTDRDCQSREVRAWETSGETVCVFCKLAIEAPS